MMDWFNTIKEIFGSAGTFIMLFIAWKSGMLRDILSFKKNGKENGNSQKLQDYINEEQKEINKQMAVHALKANEEMSDIKADIKIIKDDLSDIKSIIMK